ncbi:hypothetical protein H2201_004498 [Coniosporium apollinis]|uniref:Trafficking protein particle complex subunit 11 domain-containing protein n=1 Tax=Coniosporium apollinis TaxID=61459 RepID=A0ABQ9NSP9_9PEZI|nr:hypothetical protein H2201_004498 [Coniosporium apollinis]
MSFDLRVSQYEEDIREKDSQRALPGWNFCTFFVLKEGLARGFESVGLVEDALVGYDELSIGLDTVIREQAAGGSPDHGGAFLMYTEDLQRQALAADEEAQESSNAQSYGRSRSSSTMSYTEDKPISSKRKDYRDLVLSSNISVFDFKCYIFSRQMALLLRLANAHSSRSELMAKPPTPSISNNGQLAADGTLARQTSGQGAEDSEDLASLAEICQRALSFITSVARIMREDLEIGLTPKLPIIPHQLIDHMVSSWEYSVAEQVLDETATPSLPLTVSGPDSTNASSLNALQRYSQEPRSMIPSSRTTTPHHGKRDPTTDPPYSRTPASGQIVYEHGRFHENQPAHAAGVQPPPVTGSEELAAYRAELYLLQRRILERVGKGFGWSAGWAAVNALLPIAELTFSEVSLDEEEPPAARGIETDVKPEGQMQRTQGLSSTNLATAASSIDEFRSLYERLSDYALRHYIVARRPKSGESILGDLAALKFQIGDYAGAATHFSHMAPSYSERRWNLVDTIMLKMHAECLKKLNRKDEYCRAMLDLLAKSAAHARSNMFPRIQSLHIQSNQQLPVTKGIDWLDDESIDTTGFLSELVTYSEQLPYSVTAPMTKYFGDLIVEPYIRHLADRDGFELRVRFRHLLEDDLDIQRVRVRLVSMSSAQDKEIWLETEGHLLISRGPITTWVKTNVTTDGSYMVDKLVFECNKITFVHEPFAKAETVTPLGLYTAVPASPVRSAKKSRILSFPPPQAFAVEMTWTRDIHIQKTRSIELGLSSGWNDIQKAELRLRSGTAGLRLRSSEVAIAAGDLDVQDTSRPGIIEFSGLDRGQSAVLRIPYDVEENPRELAIRLEATYYTKKGTFEYFAPFTVSVDLPLDVNVHDAFKETALFSTFNIKAANNTPIELLSILLRGPESLSVQPPPCNLTPMIVFPKQPALIMYKIIKNTAGEISDALINATDAPPLELEVDYRCINEVVSDQAKAYFTAAVDDSEFNNLSRLLIKHFVTQFQQQLGPAVCERTALLSTIPIGSYEDFLWADMLESLPGATRPDLKRWLREWHKTNATVPLRPTASTHTSEDSTTRRVVVTVTLPKAHVVHTARLHLLNQEQASSRTPPTVAVGEPLMAMLCVKHTRQWNSPSATKTAAGLADASDPIEFTYTIDAQPDTWLIGGQRRAHFSARENEPKGFPVMLIPLRPGNLLLPSVEIRPRLMKQRGSSEAEAWDRSSSAGKGADAGEAVMVCETDYESQAQSVLVIPNLKSTTVGLGNAGISVGGSILLEAEHRHTGVS